MTYMPQATIVTGAVVVLDTATLEDGGAEMVFDHIPSIYRHVSLTFQGAASGRATPRLALTFNRDNSGSYRQDGADASTYVNCGPLPFEGTRSLICSIAVPYHASGTFAKLVRVEWLSGAGGVGGGVVAASWYYGTPVGTITLRPTSGTFMAGTTATLYGLH